MNEQPDEKEDEPVVSVNALCELFDLTDTRIHQLSREGVVQKADHGQFFLWPSIKGYIKKLKGSGKSTESQDPDYERDKARMMKARADIEEQKAARLKAQSEGAPSGNEIEGLKEITPEEPGFCSSMSQAEAVTGISKSFQIWAKKEGCEAFKASRVFLLPLREYYRSYHKSWQDAGGSEEVVVGSQEAVNRERIISMRRQQRKLDREHEVAMGSLVSVEAVKERQGKLVGALTGILKKTLSREDYNAVARQFQKVDFGE
jgi:hypothetical protein